MNWNAFIFKNSEYLLLSGNHWNHLMIGISGNQALYLNARSAQVSQECIQDIRVFIWYLKLVTKLEHRDSWSEYSVPGCNYVQIWIIQLNIWADSTIRSWCGWEQLLSCPRHTSLPAKNKPKPSLSYGNIIWSRWVTKQGPS